MIFFKSIEDAKNTYIEGLKIAEKAGMQGDAKTNNNVIRNQVTPAFEYLKKEKELKILISYLDQDNDVNLKQSIAVALLPHYEEIAIKVLEEISNGNTSNSFTAKMVLKQWRKGLY